MEDTHGLDILSQDPDIGSGVEQRDDQMQRTAAKDTKYSLLDMDLSVVPDLSQPLLPLDICSQDGAVGQSG